MRRMDIPALEQRVCFGTPRISVKRRETRYVPVQFISTSLHPMNLL